MFIALSWAPAGSATENCLPQKTETPGGLTAYLRCDTSIHQSTRKSDASFDRSSITFSSFLLHRILNRMVVCSFPKGNKCTGAFFCQRDADVNITGKLKRDKDLIKGAL